MFGYRGRMGLIVPSSNTTMEMEFRSVLPEGVSLHVARIRLVNVTEGELTLMEKDLEDAVTELTDAGVGIIVYGCTTGSLVKGVGYDIQLQKKISDIGGVRSLTTSRAVLRALEALSLKRISVGTPYTDEVTGLEIKFLEGNGLSVAASESLGLEENLRIGNLHAQDAYLLGRRLNAKDAQGLFLSCTNMRTFDVIDALERDVSRPVVTSNQATLWAAVRDLGLADKMQGLGRLFSQ